MIISPDQIGKTIRLDYPAKRIVSLVPSITEYLYDLGLDAETLGITKFCVHPDSWFRTKTRIGGTKNISYKKIKDLQPDLILASKEENVKEQVEELEIICPVWTADVAGLDDSLVMMKEIGNLTGRKDNADQIITAIAAGFSTIIPHSRFINTAYLIWKDPYMAAGGDSFIHDMLKRCGLNNVFSEINRYPVTCIDDLRTRNTELVLLSSEPYPFKEQHVHEFQAALPECRVFPVDGEMFSWYGSRMLQSPAWFRHLISLL